jgi:5-methylcytosine-specific restriction endonuclease McrBC GTP-binding regulatory subunit McrB
MSSSIEKFICNEDFRIIYEKWDFELKSLFDRFVDLIHYKKYDFYFVELNLSNNSGLRFGIKEKERKKAASGVCRIFLKETSITIGFFEKDLHYFFNDNDKNFFSGTKPLSDNYLNKLEEDLKESSNLEPKFPCDYGIDMSNEPLNRILFGPPGTGKTYNTINHALKILEPGISLDKRDDLPKKFQDFVDAGQIVFTTFHQSYGYEEFIEGIKALPPKSECNESDQVVYDVVPGIFKRICEAASKKYEIAGSNNDQKHDIREDAKVWKVSLGGAKKQEVKTNCFNDSVIRIGWQNARIQALSATR